MNELNTAYIIPPYILHTALGEKLKRLLTIGDEQFGRSNLVSFQSPNFYDKETNKKASVSRFSPDPVINEIIRNKLIYKLAILGVLGSNPLLMEMDDEYLFDLLATFKDRILESQPGGPDAEISEETLEGETTPLQSSSDMSQPGEFVFKFMSGKWLPEKYIDIARKPLKELLLSMKESSDKRNFVPPSFIRFSNGDFFNYPLPSFWSPLAPADALKFLRDELQIQAELIRGFPALSFKCTDTHNATEKLNKRSKNRYFNFITNKPVPPSAGVFYYEIQVKQQCSLNTNFQPIIPTGKLSVDSNSTLQLSMGYTSQFLKFETNSISKTNLQERNVETVNLETLREEIQHFDDKFVSASLNSELKDAITSQPGEFKGSFALNFENLTFYNSAQRSESYHRAALSNMSRRLSSLSRQSGEDPDAGKTPLKINFSGTLKENENNLKIAKTDVIGCGINFIEKSMFYTVNGVLVENVSKENLQSKGNTNDTCELFLSDHEKSFNVFPIIGFKINDLLLEDSSRDSATQLEIKSNLGFEEFEFDLLNYFSRYKTENQQNVTLSILEQMRDSKSGSSGIEGIERSILKIDENSSFLHNLIKGYLNHESYIDTFNAFNSDLQSIEDTLEREGPTATKVDPELIVRSQAFNRHKFKSILLNLDFERALDFLREFYPKVLDDDEDICFEIKTFKYLHLIKYYLDVKLSLSTFDFEPRYESGANEEDTFHAAYSYGIKLHSEYERDHKKIKLIENISSALLVNDIEVLKKLPKVNYFLHNYVRLLNKLADSINKKILVTLGFKADSDLEQIFKKLDEKVSILSLEHNDENFMLINLERDHL